MKRFLLLILALVSAFTALARDADRVAFDSLATLCRQSRQTLSLPLDYPNWLSAMQKIVDRTADPRLRWQALLWEADMQRRDDRLDLATPLIQQASELVDSVAFPHDAHLIAWTRTLIVNTLDAVDIYRMAQQQLKYYSSIDDLAMMAEMHRHIGLSYIVYQRNDKAVEHLDLSNALYRRAQLPGEAVNNEILLMEARLRLGQEDTLRRLYPRLLVDRQSRRDTIGIVTLLNTVSLLGIDSAAVLRALPLALASHNKALASTTLQCLGNYWLGRGNARKAIPYFYEAIEVMPSNSVDQVPVLSNVWAGLEKSYASLGMLDSAYISAMNSVALSDSLNFLNRPGRFQDLYERLALEREEALFRAEKQKEQNKLIIIILTFTILLLGAGGLAWFYHSRRRLREAEASRLADSLQREQLQREIYQRRSQESERELTANSLLLIEKRRMIEEMNSTIEQHGEEGTISDDTKRELMELINRPDQFEQYQQQFYEYFNRVYPEFFSTLNQRFGRLTKGDLRLCAYIRIGLDNKQMAQILSVSPDAIKKARYRLRGKLALPTAESLEDFLLSL